MKHLRWLIPVAAALALGVVLLVGPGSGSDPTTATGPRPNETRTDHAPELRGTSGAPHQVPAVAAGASHSADALTGTIYDESGAPIPAAVVLCMRVSTSGATVYDAMEQTAVRAVSRPSGAYRAALEPGLYVIRARMGERESRRHEVRVPRDAPLDLQLVEATASLAVQFDARHPDIDPKALGIRVIAGRGRVEPPNRRGEFPITGLRVGDVVSLHVSLGTKDRSIALLPSQDARREYLIGDRIMQAVVTIEQPTNFHVFPVARLARIQGRLRSGRSDAPRAKYAIACLQRDSGWSPEVALDTSVTPPAFSVWVMPGRRTSLFVKPTRVGDDVLATPRPVLLDALDSGEETEVGLNVSKLRHEIWGQIVDVDGLPVPRAGVRVVQSVDSGLQGSGTAAPYRYTIDGATGPDGGFELTGLIETASILDVIPPRFATGVTPLPVPITEWREGLMSVGVIQLPRGGGIDGTLRLSGGGRQVTTQAVTIRVLPVGHEGQPWIGRLRRIQVDHRDGATFSIEDLAPGTYRLLGPGRISEIWSESLAEVRVEPGAAATTEIVWKP